MPGFISSTRQRLLGTRDEDHQYTSISGQDAASQQKRGLGPMGEKRRKPIILVVCVALTVLVSMATIKDRYLSPELESLVVASSSSSHWNREHKAMKGCEQFGACDPSAKVWGQYSPFFPVPSEIDNGVPKGCEVTFAQVLSRHGARFPTTKKSDLYRSLIDRIHKSATGYGVGYEFIKDYNYTLGKDQLTGFGEQQLVDSGIAFYLRYKSLVTKSDPFFRAAGSDRVILSGQRFIEGLYEALGKDPKDKIDSLLVIPENEYTNNTMNHGRCTNFEQGPNSEIGDDKQNKWKGVWAPKIMTRLNEKLPGVNLTLSETVSLMDMCPFDTVSHNNGAVSQFCRLFSSEEWKDYDYYQTLDKWYGYGLGNPLGPTQGVGYVNELIARLTGQPVKDDTTTNKTLDSSPATFPLDRTVYADFSHDNDMVTIFNAMGLYNGTDNLPVGHRISAEKTGGFSAAWVVPFGSRMYVEKMECGVESGGKGKGKGKGRQSEELVRVLVNDRVVPLKNCGADKLGRCRLGAFVDSLSFAREGGHWNQCFS